MEFFTIVSAETTNSQVNLPLLPCTHAENGVACGSVDRDDARAEVVEEEVEAWIVEFKKEIDRIETFFKKNLRELKAEFKKLEK